MTTNVNTNVDDKLFYFFGVKPLEKEFANFDKKVCEFIMEQLQCSKVEAFMSWQTYKMQVRLMHISNFPIVIASEVPIDLGSSKGVFGGT